MKQINFHGLRFQLLLVGKLFLACIIASIYMVYHRPWVESFLKERYQPPPKSLQPVITKIKMGQLIQEAYQQTPQEHRVLLFDFWMASEPIASKLPPQLFELDGAMFVSRAERALVAGSHEQRVKALEFFRLGKHVDAIPVLEKALSWAKRRKMPELVAAIDSTTNEIKQLQGN